MGKSIADLDAKLGGGLDTTGPRAKDHPDTRTSVLAEKLRTKLAARGSLPADPGPIPDTVQVGGKARYGGATGPLVVARKPRPQVREAATTAADIADPLIGLTHETERFLGAPAPVALNSPGAVHRRQALQNLDRGTQPVPQRGVPGTAADEKESAVRVGAGPAAPEGDALSKAPVDGSGAPAIARALRPDDEEPVAETEDPPPGEPPNWPGPFQFVTGPAGCGKTYLARNWGKHDKGFLLCATTGIAAVNLGDAVTINSTLRYFNTESLEESFISGHLQSRMRKLRSAGVTRYGIDEVSMMPARVLTLITQAVEELNSDAAVGMRHEPEIGVTLIGDFLQLPPVKEEYAFQSPEWHKYEAHMTKLTDSYRHDDPDFIRALRAVRLGEPEGAMDVLGPHIKPTIDTHFDGTTILAKNIQVDRFNKLRHQALPGDPITFKNTTTGKPLKEWEKHIPMFVGLKKGAHVMILANRYQDRGDDAPELIYANGDTGIFVDGDPGRKFAQIQLKRNGLIVPVSYNVRQNLVPTGAKGKKKDRYEVLGEIEYMPLRLAYATSVHKSQGLTLDSVQVDISDPFFTSPAMVYVALSRARNLQGLRMVGNPALLAKRCTVDPLVERWR